MSPWTCWQFVSILKFLSPAGTHTCLGKAMKWQPKILNIYRQCRLNKREGVGFYGAKGFEKKIVENLWIHNGSGRIHKTFYTFDFFLSFLNKLTKTIISLILRPSQRQLCPRNAVPATAYKMSRGLEFQNIAVMKLRLWGVTRWNLRNGEVHSRMQLGSRKPKEAKRKWSQRE